MSNERRSGRNPQEAEKGGFDAQACFHHSLRHTPPRIESLSSHAEFDETFMPGIEKKRNIITDPNVIQAVSRNLLPVIKKGFKYTDRFESFFVDNLKKRGQEIAKTARGYNPTWIDDLEDTDPKKDFAVISPSPDTHYLVVTHPEDKHRFVKVNLSELHVKEPAFVGEGLFFYYLSQGMTDVVQQARKNIEVHRAGTAIDSFIPALDDDVEKRKKELTMIKDVIETVGGMNQPMTQQTAFAMGEYKKDTIQEGIRKDITSQIDHLQECSAGPTVSVNFFEKVKEATNMLGGVSVTANEDPLLQNPRKYFEKVSEHEEQMITNYETLNEFLTDERKPSSYSELIQALDEQLPEVVANYLNWNRENEDEIRQLIAAGLFSKFPIQDLKRLVKIPTNEPLQSLFRLLTVRMIQDRIRSVHTREEARLNETAQPSENAFASVSVSLSTEWMFTQPRIGELDEFATEFIDDIQDNAQNAESKREEIRGRRGKMKAFLEREGIDKDVLTQIGERMDGKKPQAAQDTNFATAFHLYRLQKAGKVDMDSMAVRAAIIEFFPQGGPEAVAIVEDLAAAA